MTTYTLSFATDDTRALIVSALRAAAGQRDRVAQRASRTVAEDKRAGQDVRSSAVKVITIVAEAAELNDVADQLENAAALPVVSTTALPAVIDAATGAPVAVDDDGTSIDAQLAAARAGLTATDPDDVEDPETAALPEDDPAATIPGLDTEPVDVSLEADA